MAFIDTEQRFAGEMQQKVGRMRLSEAIRIGARIRPQCSQVYGDEYAGTSCAIGAAWEAVTGQNPWEVEPLKLDEILGRTRAGIRSEIFSRNDSGESRESIADWLEAQGL
jgi:hypothetical protein